MADYLETYAATFELPVCLETTVEALGQQDGHYVVETEQEARQVTAENVVVATGAFATPNVPAFGDELDPTITQFHSTAYRNPEQVSEGAALVVGAGNAGAEIATDLAATGRRTFLSGRKTGSIPLSVFNSRPFWWLGRDVITADSWLCKKIEQRSRARGDPLVRLTERKIQQAGVERVARTQGVKDGKPVLDGERPLGVASVVWATGFQPDYGWIDLPRLRFDGGGYPVHDRGVVPAQPGLYFIGLPYQSTLVSASLGGVGADARYVVDHLRTN
ncbi:FAD-dependent pyridine nucleotide-disulfide oxidoreductase [Halococcus salifodinae DSM 8989]|uniref:FAD-dependent pyridine nucleotide-disulfide oxidoreductase n=1 Tax=Halococcus salifodinae DSM 8989 TaxID=1227456 RepID=M0MZT0_9EURY|nr:FAD-dependent pyridine nucleotide-disulfide oxidoreductase [Halococcus salifodinae DSM 8989]